MARLTEDMTRLSGEIRALHGSREALIKGLVRGANDLRHIVSGMRAGFRNAHNEMARRTKADRLAFVSGLKRTVAGLRREFAGDLAGARRAWFGKG